MSDRLVKGHYVVAMAAFVEKNFKAHQDRIIAQLSPEVREALPNIKRNDWYPVHYVSDFCRGMEAVNGDFNKTKQDVVNCGKYVGDEAISTYMRLLLKVLTPKMFFGQFSAFWKRYHNFGDSKPDMSRITENRVTFDVDGYDYVHWIGAGWIYCVCEALGQKDVLVTDNCPDDKRTIPSVRWTVTWS